MFNKKGNALILLVVLFVGLVIFGLVSLLGNFAINEINSELQIDADLSNESKAIAADTASTYPDVFDGSFVFFFIMIWAFMLVGAYFVETSPIWFIIALVAMIGLLIISVYLSNAFEEITDDSDIKVYAEQMPMMLFIMEKFLWIVLAMIFSVVIVLYSRDR